VDSRERILAEALRLFAEQGYAATSVGQIQVAAGMTHGSGALYKHFRSKEDLLAAAVERHVEEYGHAKATLMPALPDDPAEALEIIGRSLLDTLAANAQLVRVSFRDLEKFPELSGKIADGVLRPLFRDFANWLDSQAKAGRFKEHDSEAVAAVLFSAISYHRVLDLCMGIKPADIDTDRFVRTWVTLAVSALDSPVG
jgi:AcrR family transcriptional regulator